LVGAGLDNLAGDGFLGRKGRSFVLVELVLPLLVRLAALPTFPTESHPHVGVALRSKKKRKLGLEFSEFSFGIHFEKVFSAGTRSVGSKLCRSCSILSLLPCGTTEIIVTREVCRTSEQLEKLPKLFSEQGSTTNFLL
jgi:hypothetical protein